MHRRELTRIMASAPLSVLEKISHTIEKNHDIQVIEEPVEGLLMIKMRETAQRSLFYLGEVLITQCKVLLGEEIGLGILQGNRPEAARYMAIVDAGYRARVPEMTAVFMQLADEKLMQEQVREAEKGRIASTMVDFETVYEEVKF